MPSDFPELPAATLEALSKAALFEEPFPIQALVSSGTRPHELDALFDSELLEETEPGYATLGSAADRAAVLQRLSWSAKRKLSLSLAETCVTLALPADAVARLYLQAQHFDHARRHFTKAARTACKSHDYKTALFYIESALEVWPINEDVAERKSALAEMARCASNSAHHQAASRALEELLEMAAQENAISEQIDLNQRLAQAAITRGEHLEARERLEAGAALAESCGDTIRCARIKRRLAQTQGDALRLRDALLTLESVTQIAEQRREWALLSDSLAYAAMLTAMLGHISDARELLEKALAIAIENDLSEQITNAYRRQANINEYASNYEAYRDSELAALDRCRSLDERDTTQACLACVSYAFFRLGQYEESLAAIEEAVVDLKTEGELRAAALCVKACIHALRTRSSDVQSQLDEAIRLNRIHGSRVFEFYALWAMGAHAVLTDKTEQAHEAFDTLVSFWKETDDRKDSIPGLLCAATFFANETKDGKLATCIDILNTCAEANESQEPRYALLSARAEEAWTRGRAEDAIQRFSEALEGYRELHLAFEQAWILWRIAHIRSQIGPAADATISWKDAEMFAKRYGLKPLLQAIARDKNHERSNAISAPALTARQLEVARLLAAGQSNKEAAESLGISPRTVEMHVAALIERLDCRTRAEAASKASQLGLL